MYRTDADLTAPDSALIIRHLVAAEDGATVGQLTFMLGEKNPIGRSTYTSRVNGKLHALVQTGAVCKDGWRGGAAVYKLAA